jgi:hypothetical protein
VCSISLDKLYALDKRCSRATLSRLGGINAKADPGDTRCPTLVEVSFERSVEVVFTVPSTATRDRSDEIL